jgi:hypothetical protein
MVRLLVPPSPAPPSLPRACLFPCVCVFCRGGSGGLLIGRRGRTIRRSPHYPSRLLPGFWLLCGRPYFLFHNRGSHGTAVAHTRADWGKMPPISLYTVPGTVCGCTGLRVTLFPEREFLALLLLQAIHARTMLPCQDAPGVKFTYEALVTVPKVRPCVRWVVHMRRRCASILCVSCCKSHMLPFPSSPCVSRSSQQ